MSAPIDIVAQLMAEQIADYGQLRELARRVDARAKVIEGYQELYPELEELAKAIHPAFMPVDQPTVDEDADLVPRGQAAVEQVLQTLPGIWWSVQQIVQAMEARGWLPDSRDPAAAVRAALQRAWDDDDSLVWKSGEGRSVRWAWAPPEAFDDEAAEAAANSDLDEPDIDFDIEPTDDDIEKMRRWAAENGDAVA